MNYTMNPNSAIFNGIKDQIVLNNKKAISHTIKEVDDKQAGRVKLQILKIDIEKISS